MNVQINSMILLVVCEILHVEAGEARIHPSREYPTAKYPIVNTMEVVAIRKYLMENAEGDTVVAIAEQLARYCIWYKEYFEIPPKVRIAVRIRPCRYRGAFNC